MFDRDREREVRIVNMEDLKVGCKLYMRNRRNKKKETFQRKTCRKCACKCCLTFDLTAASADHFDGKKNNKKNCQGKLG